MGRGETARAYAGLSGSPSPGLSAQNVTLRFERAKLKTVMDEITRQCDLSFAYSREVVDADRIVSIDLKDAPIDAALQSLFPSGNGIDYAIKNRKILLSAGKQSLHVDTVVSGRGGRRPEPPARGGDRGRGRALRRVRRPISTGISRCA